MTAPHPTGPGSSGTVRLEVLSFLLTDVVGSTALWDTAPTAMEPALRRHDALVADVVSAHGGELIRPRGEGDSTFCVFRSPVAAVNAAVAAQRALNAEPWPLGARIVVRMGIHTGEAIPREADYYGSTVNRAARIRALALGNQVLVSESTADLVVDDLRDDVDLVELGTRKLAGLVRPERIYAVVAPGLLGVAPEAAAGDGGAVPFPVGLATAVTGALLGRDDQRRGMFEAFERSSSEQRGRAVFVVGDPGIGKTSLVAHAARDLHDAGATVLYGQSDDVLGIAYEPFVKALSALIDHLATEDLAVHVANHGAQLAQLVPDLGRRAGVAPEAVAISAGTDRYLLFAAVAHLLGLEAAQRPVVLVLEDLHWADVQTVQLLRYLLTTAAPLRLFVMATYRDTDVPDDHPLARVATDLQTERIADRIHLSGLDRDGVLQLVRDVCADEHDATHVAALVRLETNGNPLLAGEVIRHLSETDQIGAAAELPVGASLSQLGIPETVRELVRRRVANLGEGAREVLPVAALIGREFELEWLTGVVERDEDDVLAFLETATTAGLVEESPETIGMFAFTHSLVQQSLCDQVNPTRRRRWRVHIAETLERLCREDPEARIEDLANCWLAAGDANVEKTVAYACRAGERAIARFAPDDSVQWYTNALERVDETPRLPTVTRVQVLIGLGDAQRQAGRRVYRATLLEAAAIARKQDEPELLVRSVLANHRGYESIAGQVDDERVAMLNAALESLAGREPLTRARLLATLAAELTFAADRAQTWSVADEALSMARASGDERTLLSVLSRRFLTILAPDTLHECLANSGEQLELADHLNDPIATLFAAVYRANACLGVGDIDGTDRSIAIADRVTEVVRQPFLRHLVLTTKSWRASLAGDVAEGERLATAAFEIGTASGIPEARGAFAAQIFRAREAQGRLDELLPLLEQSARRPDALPAYKAVLCMAYCRLGRAEDAHATFDAEAARRFVDLPWDRFGLIGMAGYAEICEYLDEHAPALELYDRMRPWHDQVSFSIVSTLGSVARHCGLLASVLRDFDAAETHFREAEAMNGRLRAPAYLAQTWLDWARMLLRRGAGNDVEQARALLDQSIREADRVAYAPVATRARSIRDSSPSLT